MENKRLLLLATLRFHLLKQEMQEKQQKPKRQHYKVFVCWTSKNSDRGIPVCLGSGK